MKKVLRLAAVVCAAALLAACGSAPAASSSAAPSQAAAPSVQTTPEPTTAPKDETAIRVAAMKGPTGIGMVKLMSDAEEGKADFHAQFDLYGAADEIVPLMVQGQLDVAALPVNVASVLYNKTQGNIQLAAVNTLGVLYIVSKGEEVKTVEDLAGKTVYATGKGTTPEMVLNHLLSAGNVADVQVEYKSEATEVVAALAAGESTLAMLPQPYVTVAQTKVEGLEIALDLTREWDRISPDSMLVTGGLLVNAAFAKEHPQLLASFLQAYAESTDWVNANVAEAAQLTEHFDIVKAAIAQKAIPYCNITCLTGADLQKAARGYLQVLFDANPAAVGGSMPGDDFYYEG